MTSSQLDINEIVKEMRVLHEKIDKLENIVEKRLVGIEKPDS
jgi:tetrahydromethanopterin S-methyltransferase subunit B